MCVTVFSVTATKNSDISPNLLTGVNNNASNRDPWDLLAEYNIGATGTTALNGNAGAEFDGTYLYSTRWASALIHRHNKDGSLAEEFSIAGVTGLRDLAYDGTQYMYGGAAAGTIWKMDFTTKTLIGTITGGFQSRAIAYDWDLDVLYVSNWGDPVWKVDPTNGAILGTFNLGVATSTYGFAYDPDPDGPYLWVFDQTTGATSTIYQYDLGAGAMTGFTYNVGNDVGSGVGIAGGLWAGEGFADATFTLGGCVQDSSAPGVTDWLFVYDLYATGPPNDPPATPGKPSGPTSGVIETDYSFTASTTDPEGDDVYYWFDWDDGTNSGWLGPYASGATVTATHAWSSIGDYDITVKAKDEFDHESGVSAPHTISILESPVLKVEWIMGGLFNVKTLIKNVGGLTANNIAWSITLEGGAFIGKETTGTIASLAPGAGETVKSKFILGFGATVVKVTATIPESSDMKEQSGTVLLFFIKL